MHVSPLTMLPMKTFSSHGPQVIKLSLLSTPQWQPLSLLHWLLELFTSKVPTPQLLQLFFCSVHFSSENLSYFNDFNNIYAEAYQKTCLYGGWDISRPSWLWNRCQIIASDLTCPHHNLSLHLSLQEFISLVSYLGCHKHKDKTYPSPLFLLSRWKLHGWWFRL